MAEMNIVKAVNSALDNMLEKDENVLFFGQDAGYFGGVFGTSEGLQNKFGSHRVFDTPLSEGGIAAIAFGMGINGLRPVAEIQFADYIFPAYDQIVNEIAKVRHRSGGEFWCPVTFRTPAGGGIRGGHHHSQSPESQFTHTPGLKVVYASTPYNAKGLLIAAIECNDPVIVLEPKRCYRGPFYGDPHNVPTWKDHPEAQVPESHYTVEIGKARLALEGNECTVIAWGAMVHVALNAAREAAQRGIEAEIIDLRTILPFDAQTCIDSVRNTGRLLVLQESQYTGGFGHTVSSRILEEAFWNLESAPVVLGALDTPVPFSPTLEDHTIPSAELVLRHLRRMCD